MPELPEVEIITRELNDKLRNDKISDYRIFWHKTFVLNSNLELIGRVIKGFTRKGKYIICQLDAGFLVAHLRMTGKFIIYNNNNYNQNYLQTVFHLASGRYLLFYDIRKFGRIYFTCNLDIILKNVGIDILSDEFTKTNFKILLKRGKSKLKSFLMNQKYFAGLGNIYTDESLFAARLHPEKIQNNLTSNQADHLFDAILDTLNKAIQNMGTTISDYKTTENIMGDNQNYLKVYGRENKSCFLCGFPIKKININNRSTCFCSNCQKM